MKYFQLFGTLPDEDFLVVLLNCYNIRDLTDTHEFTKGDLIEYDTVEHLNEIIPELVMYYLPCKAKIYLNEITEKRAITILAQFLKIFDYRLMREERIINRKKIIFYNLHKLEDSKLHILRNALNYEIVFK